MNIFCLDKNPKTAAQYHCDKHLVKMILESCQLLCTAHRMIDGQQFIGITKSGRKIKRWKLDDDRDSFLYTATHINHPSAVWCRDNLAQYLWLAQLTIELCIEYTYRYGKVHKCQESGLVKYLIENPPRNIKTSDYEFTLPTPAMPDDCKVNGDVVQSYRNYYNMYKQRMLSWKGKINNRPVPNWVIMENKHAA